MYVEKGFVYQPATASFVASESDFNSLVYAAGRLPVIPSHAVVSPLYNVEAHGVVESGQAIYTLYSEKPFPCAVADVYAIRVAGMGRVYRSDKREETVTISQRCPRCLENRLHELEYIAAQSADGLLWAVRCRQCKCMFFVRRDDLVDAEDACPTCGACSQHELVWKSEEVLHCQVCDTFYVPGSVKEEIAHALLE